MNENTNPDAQTIESTADSRPWEPLNGGPVRAGYEVRRDGTPRFVKVREGEK